MNLKIVTDKIQSENHDDKNDAGDHDIPCIRCNIATGIGHYVPRDIFGGFIPSDM